MKVAGVHARVLWHASQLEPMAAVWLDGFVWQDAHADDRPPKVFGLV